MLCIMVQTYPYEVVGGGGEMRFRTLIGGGLALAVAAFPIMDRTAGARSQVSPMQRVSAAAAGAKRALGPRIRYLSSAWQNALGIGARMEIEKALGTPVDLDQFPTLQAPSASMQLISFAPSSAPPNLAALGTRFSGFTTNETSTAWCGSNITVGFNDSGSPFESLGGSVVGYSQSSNTGTSYTDEGALPPFSA